MAVEPRIWGDGGGKSRRHEIEAMSYDFGVIVCAIDHEVVRFGDIPADVAWDKHRGIVQPVEQRVLDRAALATDSEVNEFLRWAAKDDKDDRLPPTVSRSVVFAADHATGDIETALDFVETIREMQARCTCDTTAVEDCPNYMTGDEEEGEIE